MTKTTLSLQNNYIVICIRRTQLIATCTSVQLNRYLYNNDLVAFSTDAKQ